MGLVNNIFDKLAKKKLGSDFEERVMRSLEENSCLEEDSICKMVEHYQSIIKLLSPNYSSVKLNSDDLLNITIDDIEYNLDDKSKQNLRKAAEHRMAIEFLIADFEDQKQIISKIEARLNKDNLSK